MACVCHPLSPPYRFFGGGPGGGSGHEAHSDRPSTYILFEWPSPRPPGPRRAGRGGGPSKNLPL